MIKAMLTRTMAALSGRPVSGEPEMNLEALYRKYRDTCLDRGVFAKSRTELDKNDEADWLMYATSLIEALPSREERMATLTSREERKAAKVVVCPDKDDGQHPK